LLKDIDPTALDFIRKCLVINGAERFSCEQLLSHAYFDEAFKKNFVNEVS
jgi:serine/threonine protein kinase